MTDWKSWSGLFYGRWSFHWQGFTMNILVPPLCSEHVITNGPLYSTNAIVRRIFYLWLKQKISSPPSSRMYSSRALATYLSKCKLFFVIMNFNKNCWRHLWNKISIGMYPTLCWNSEHPHGNFIVGSRYVFDNYASIEKRYALIPVFHVSMSLFFFEWNDSSINSYIPKYVGKYYCKILIHHGRNWVGMNLQIDSLYSWNYVLFNINQIKPHQATLDSLF